MLKNNKFIIVIVILISISLIWYIKSSQQSKGGITDHSDYALVIDKIDMDKFKSLGVPILIDFGSDGCEPCKIMAPALEKINKKYKDKALVKFLDVWKYADAAKGYPVKLIPTQIFISKSGSPYKPSGSETIELEMFYDTKNNHVFTTHLGSLNEREMTEIIELMEKQ